ncbi:TetR/AcrR family transcriptional regulator [Micromonosporaceae bacterium Da 78-11]
MPRVSEDHLTARREQILVAARACFLRNGLHHTSMQDLIQEAGLSVGAVYRYFKSKNEIINAIADSVAGALKEQINEISARRLPLIESMSLLLEAIDVQLEPDGNFPLALQVWTEATLEPAVGDIVRVRYRGMRDSVRVLVDHAIEVGELPADADGEAVATALFGMIPGYALQRLLVGTPDRATYLAGWQTLMNRS